MKEQLRPQQTAGVRRLWIDAPIDYMRELAETKSDFADFCYKQHSDIWFNRRLSGSPIGMPVGIMTELLI